MFKIYKITNQINGKSYIGKTSKTLEQRWVWHKRDTKVKKYRNIYFYNALSKYGPENFTIKELDCTENEQQANWLESWYIAITWSYKPEIGYNSTMGGDGVIPNLETRQKIRESLQGKKHPMFGHTGDKNPFYGKTHTEESKHQMSLSHMGNKSRTGLPHSEETKKKISAVVTGTQLGNKHRLGKFHSEMTRKKMSESQKKRYHGSA
jgi:group I intron endonuclease